MAIPKVSIGVPVYNGEKYLASALDSLLRQDFEDFELIISDNASADRTQEICRQYASKDKRIRYFRNETNIGASGNYNRVFELARGEYFKWAAHDDECGPSFVRRCLEVIEQSPPSVVLVYPCTDMIDECGQVRFHGDDYLGSPSAKPHERFIKFLKYISLAYPLWGIIRSSYLRQTKLMGSFHADYILLAELVLRGQLVEIPDVLLRMRLHEGNALAINRNRRAILAWHDPALKNRKAWHPLFWLPMWEMIYWQFAEAVHDAPIPLSERMLCYAAIPGVGYIRRFRNFAGRHRRRLKEMVSRRLQKNPALG